MLKYINMNVMSQGGRVRWVFSVELAGLGKDINASLPTVPTMPINAMQRIMIQ